MGVVFRTLDGLRDDGREERDEDEQRDVAPAPEAVEEIACGEEKKFVRLRPALQGPCDRQDDEEEDGEFYGGGKAWSLLVDFSLRC